MTHHVAAVKTGRSPHDGAELTLLTVAEHAKRCPLVSNHGAHITPEQNAAQVVFFLSEHLDAATLAAIKASL